MCIYFTAVSVYYQFGSPNGLLLQFPHLRSTPAFSSLQFCPYHIFHSRIFSRPVHMHSQGLQRVQSHPQGQKTKQFYSVCWLEVLLLQALCVKCTKVGLMPFSNEKLKKFRRKGLAPSAGLIPFSTPT